MQEQWKAIEGYNGDYEVSNLGRVMSHKHGRKKELKQCLSKGYPFVRFYNGSAGSGRSFPVYWLVWDAFGDRPRSGREQQIDHKDEDKLNSRIDNLQLMSQRENLSKYHQTQRDLPTGVYKYPWGYVAFISGKNIKHCNLGTFDTPGEASDAYQQALRKV